MIELIKLLGKGLLTIIMSPFIAVAYVFYIIYAIIGHLVNEVKMVLLFFTGKRITDDDKETKMLKEYREKLISRNNPFSPDYQKPGTNGGDK